MSFQPSDPHYEDRVRASFARQRFMDFLGAHLIAVRPGYCEIHLPYKESSASSTVFFTQVPSGPSQTTPQATQPIR